MLETRHYARSTLMAVAGALKCLLSHLPDPRRAKAQTVEALIEAINEALDTVTQADIRGWFVHCGYSIE